MASEQTPAPIDQKRLRSQRLREVNFQGDALRLGMNWTEDDLRKPQVLVESAYGMGHPGTFHFRGLVEEVSNGVFEAGGKPAEFVVSDICDGVVQATDGMSYSLISRDIMAAMIEIHALGHPHDAMVLISGNDKSVPAHLLAIARCDLPAVHVPGGTQLNAPDYVTSNQMWEMGAAVRRGEFGRGRARASPTWGVPHLWGVPVHGQRRDRAGAVGGPWSRPSWVGVGTPAADQAAALRPRRGQANPPADRRGSHAATHLDPRGIRERDRHPRGDRRLDERAASPARDRSGSRRRGHDRRL
ncbi:MAG: dihydroxy-acid dehydratase [Solirubrobacterales bacterium]|nr:dihydroxy-acid dehydratase [Solirubrobacterales bacterium]